MLDFFDTVMEVLAPVMIILMFVGLLIVCPIYGIAHMRAEASCLRRGYPKSEVTWNLRTYCIKIDGSTYTVVDP